MKIHIGCWKRFIPGFIHIDICDLPHIDYRHVVDKLPMIPDNSADLIYASHVFEYYDRQKAVDVLAEWRRVLKPGGTLRIAVPDFAALLKVYEQTKNLDNILGPLYGRMVVDMGEKEIQIIYHKTVYDFDSLKKLLEENGFQCVHRYDWRDTIHKDYDDHSQAYFPHMDKDNGLLTSLNVEATKKGG
jgi:predicted SAM-dependent methyltransferase